MRTPLLIVLATLCFSQPVMAIAGVGTYAVRETTELVLKKFGKEAAEQGAEVLSRKIATLSAKYGDNALRAFQKVGPRVSRIVDGAGPHADTALRMLATHGDDAVRIAAGKNLQLVSKYGDNCASALLRHGDAVAPLIDDLGEPAARALAGLSTRNGRRVAMLAADGHLARNADDLLAVIGKHGDSACEFIWTHKGALAVGAGLTAFLMEPEAYISGVKDLAAIVGEAAVKPLVTETALALRWVVIVASLALLIVLIAALTLGKLRLGQLPGLKFGQSVVRTLVPKSPQE